MIYVTAVRRSASATGREETMSVDRKIKDMICGMTDHFPDNKSSQIGTPNLRDTAVAAAALPCIMSLCHHIVTSLPVVFPWFVSVSLGFFFVLFFVFFFSFLVSHLSRSFTFCPPVFPALTITFSSSNAFHRCLVSWCVYTV